MLYRSTHLSGPWPYSFPTGEARRAFAGAWVYLLTDERGDVCYIGQTIDLITRIRRHATSKAFVAWEAYYCEGQAEARYYEAELIKICQPYLRHDGARR